MSLNEKEHIEYISDRLRLIVSPEHTFGTDALLLAAFALPRKKDRACDLGTGCGVIPFYWLARGIDKVSAVEIQDAAVDQLRRSAELSGVCDSLEIVHRDLRELREVSDYTVEQLANVIHPHPTVSEIIAEAAHDAEGLCVNAMPRK